MAHYRLEQNELPLNDATEQAFARFNERLDENPERLAHAIGVTALGYGEILGEDEQELAAVALEVLAATKDGTALDAGDPTWAVIYADDDHRAARHEVYATTDPTDLKIAIRRRGFCALRAIALAQLPKEVAEQAPTLDDIEKELHTDKLVAVS
jgi:hypothetical protein